MKKIALIPLMCSFPILVFSQNNDEQNTGQYIVLFNAIKLY